MHSEEPFSSCATGFLILLNSSAIVLPTFFFAGPPSSLTSQKRGLNKGGDSEEHVPL